MLDYMYSGVFFIIECYKTLVKFIPIKILMNGKFKCYCTHDR